MFLNYLYWILLILYIIGFWGPPPWSQRIGWGAAAILFVIVGIRLFRVSVE